MEKYYKKLRNFDFKFVICFKIYYTKGNGIVDFFVERDDEFI